MTCIQRDPKNFDLVYDNYVALLADADALRERLERLEAVSKDMLHAFTFPGHPGSPCYRSGWIRAETVQGWRLIVEHDYIPQSKG